MNGDVFGMQQEAARRVQRMQEHSRRVLEEYQNPPSARSRGTSIPLPAKTFYSDDSPAVSADALPGTAETSQSDADRWLLLGLAFLLLQSGGHPELTAALLYLAM